MSLSRTVFLGLLALGFLWSEVAVAAEMNLDRTMEKLAASMLRECPELKGDERTSEARQRLVAEFEKLKVDSISSDYLKKIRRGKVDYQAFAWTRLIESYEQGLFSDAKMQFLLKKAKSEKMRGEEHYVVSRLMVSYYQLKLKQRTRDSRKLLSQLGKHYTAYLKLNRKPPKNMEALQPDAAKRLGVNPLTGARVHWVYIGQGPAEVRGANRYRVIAYAPFANGKKLDYSWVVYKGGQLGNWKTQTLHKAVQKMEKKNLEVLLTPIAVIQSARKKPNPDVIPKPVTPKKTKHTAKPKLKITIRELW